MQKSEIIIYSIAREESYQTVCDKSSAGRSFQTCLRHPECTSSRENRDTVFCHMRRAIDLIHYVVRDGVLNNESNETRTNNGPNPCQRAKEVCVSSFVFWSTSCVSSSRPCCCCGCWAACSFCATTTRPVPSRRGHYFLTLANKQLTSGRHVG